jgi:translation initiation factor IF-2
MYNNAQNQQIRKLIVQDINKCDKFIGPEINAVDTEYYILFKYSAKGMDIIQKRIHNMISGLAAAGLNSRQMSDDDMRVLLDSFFNDSKRVEFGTVMTDV